MSAPREVAEGFLLRVDVTPPSYHLRWTREQKAALLSVLARYERTTHARADGKLHTTRVRRSRAVRRGG